MPQVDLFKKESIPAPILELVEAAPMPGLDQHPQCSTTRTAVEQVLRGHSGPGPSLQGTLVESALWLLAGELERSHRVSQSIESAEGSFWHGIMHRREGDFGNSKYWFRRVGRHPVHGELVHAIQSRQNELTSGDLPIDHLLEATSAASHLVDLCESAMHENSSWQPDLEKICWWEWQLLFAFCV